MEGKQIYIYPRLLWRGAIRGGMIWQRYYNRIIVLHCSSSFSVATFGLLLLPYLPLDDVMTLSAL